MTLEPTEKLARFIGGMQVIAARLDAEERALEARLERVRGLRERVAEIVDAGERRMEEAAKQREVKASSTRSRRQSPKEGS